jgi:hypothetical protein
MNTSLAEEHLNATLESSVLANGNKRWLGESPNYYVEIIPNESVSFILNEINGNVFDIINLYIRDTEKTLGHLKNAAAFVRDNPNTLFQEEIGGGLLLKVRKIQATDGATLCLTICER